MARRAKRLELSAENVLAELSKIAFSDIRAIASFDNNSVRVKDSNEIHSDAAAAIQTVEQHTSESEKSSRTTIKVKLHDKIRALEMVGRHLGLWKGDDDDSLKKMSLADLKALVLKQLLEEQPTNAKPDADPGRERTSD